MGGIKWDSAKLRWDLLPIQPVKEVVRIITFGSIKYGPNNWQHLEDFEERYYAALFRHLSDWREGSKTGMDHDRQSSCLHLSHAACNIVFLLWYSIVKLGFKPRINIRKKMTEQDFLRLHYSEKIFILTSLIQLSNGTDDKDEETLDEEWRDIRDDLLRRDETILLDLAKDLGAIIL